MKAEQEKVETAQKAELKPKETKKEENKIFSQGNNQNNNFRKFDGQNNNNRFQRNGNNFNNAGNQQGRFQQKGNFGGNNFNRNGNAPYGRNAQGQGGQNRPKNNSFVSTRANNFKSFAPTPTESSAVLAQPERNFGNKNKQRRNVDESKRISAKQRANLSKQK